MPILLMPPIRPRLPTLTPHPAPIPMLMVISILMMRLNPNPIKILKQMLNPNPKQMPRLMLVGKRTRIHPPAKRALHLPPTWGNS